jgi:hypothetical protein
VFAPNVAFYIPRYVHCLPDGKVVVLDQKALYVFRPDGGLLATLFEREAHRFRGLAYYREFGRLITTETTEDDVVLKFIDLEKAKDIVDRSVFPICSFVFWQFQSWDVLHGIIYPIFQKSSDVKGWA